MPSGPASQAMVDALGWALVHFLWQGFAFALLFALLTSPRLVSVAATRHALGAGVLFASALAPLATFALRLSDGATTQAAPALVGARPGAGFWLGAGVDAVLPWVVGLWALGVGLLTARLVLGWFGCRRLTERLTRPVEQRLEAVVASLSKRLNLARPVRVLASGRVSVPTVIGWLRPVVLLPAGAVVRMDVNQLEMVLAHEFAHVRRCDWLINLAQRIIETLLFYHPAVRWMSRRIREERELACDDIAVELTNQPVAYARTLADLESLRGTNAPLALAATGGDLRHRVERIVGQDTQRADGAFVHFTVLATLTAALTFGAADMSPRGEGLRETARACPASRARDRAIGAGAHAALGVVDGAERAPEAGLGVPAVDVEASERLAAAPSQLEMEGVALRAETEIDALTPVAEGTTTPEFASTTSSTKASSTAVAAQAMGWNDAPLGDEAAQPAFDARQAIALDTPTTPDPETLMASLPEPSKPALSLQAIDEETRFALLRGGDGPVEDEMTIVPSVMVPPDYPFQARRNNTQGFVKLAFSVDSKGHVSDIEVLEALPRRVFDRAATEALRQWRFDVDERLTENLRMVQTFDFVLEDVQMLSVAERRYCRGSVTRNHCAERTRTLGVAYVSPPRRLHPR